jgi:hypothetical protein
VFLAPLAGHAMHVRWCRSTRPSCSPPFAPPRRESKHHQRPFRSGNRQETPAEAPRPFASGISRFITD